MTRAVRQRLVTRVFGLWVIAIVHAAPAAPPTASAKLPPLNESVVSYAQAHLGKKVGDGSCATLAAEALAAAGARRYPQNRGDNDYIWGKPVENFRDALPGDILQFRDAVFQGRKRYTRGRTITWHYSFPHHSAVVSKVSEGGKVIAILHQNVGLKDVGDEEKKIVQEWSLRMDSLQKGGWVRIYRPEPRDTVPVPEP